MHKPPLYVRRVRGIASVGVAVLRYVPGALTTGRHLVRRVRGIASVGVAVLRHVLGALTAGRHLVRRALGHV